MNNREFKRGETPSKTSPPFIKRKGDEDKNVQKAAKKVLEKIKKKKS